MAFHNVPPNGFPDIPDIEDLEAVQGDIATLKTRTSEQGTAITGLTTNKAPKTDIAAAFSAESNYAVGDLVYYDGALYECTTAHEAAAWNAEDFTAASVGSALNEVSSNLTSTNGYVNSIESSVRAWAGTTLSFAIPANDHGIWCFIAHAPNNSIALQYGYIIRRSNNTIYNRVISGTYTTAYDSESGETVITLPENQYWDYSMVKVSSRY